MLAEDIDLYRMYRMHPTAMALVSADFVLVDANDEFLEVVGRELEEVMGRNIFEAFPKVPNESGNPKWTALEAALTSGKHETHQLTRYDIEVPGQPGVFDERYWCSSVVPIRGTKGQIEALELSAREVTMIVNEYRALVAAEEEDAESKVIPRRIRPRE